MSTGHVSPNRWVLCSSVLTCWQSADFTHAFTSGHMFVFNPSWGDVQQHVFCPIISLYPSHLLSRLPPPPLHGLACRSEADGVSAGLVVCMRVVYVDTLRSTLNQLRHPDTCAALALVCGCVVAAVVSIRSNWCNGLDASLKANYPPIHFVYHTVTQILVLFSYDVAKHMCEMSLCLSVWPHWIVSKKVSEVYYAWQPTSWPPHPLC